MIPSTEETKSLSYFQVKKTQLIFKDAVHYPDFFNYQLVDPHRIIKVFRNDPNALERIFYYQYLNLCMQSSEGYPRERAKNLREIFNSKEFKFTFLWNSSKFGYTDHQFKRIGQQFLEIMQSSSKTLDSLLMQYPIVDQVFTYLMRSLLIINGVAEQIQQFIDKMVVLEVLSQVFDIQFEVYGNCIRFNQSDIFAYEENPFQFYMVYISTPKLTEFALQEEQYDKNNIKNSSTIINEQLSNKKNGFISYLNSESEKQMFQNSSNSDNLSEKGYSKQSSRLKDHQYKIISKDNNESQKKEIFPFQLVPIPQIAEIIFDNFENHQQKNKKGQILFQNVLIEKVSIKKLHKNSITQSLYSPKSSGQYNELFGGSTFQVTNNSKESFEINDQKSRMILKNQIEEPEIDGNFSKQKTLSRENHKKYNTCPGSILDERNKLNICSLKNDVFFPKYSQFFEEKGLDYDKKIDTNNKITKQIPFASKLSRNDGSSGIKKESNVLDCNIQLDITKEFTNSIILNQMPQIYSERIRKTRQRARAYRKTLNKIY